MDNKEIKTSNFRVVIRVRPFLEQELRGQITNPA
jgi:hypothetical protein